MRIQLSVCYEGHAKREESIVRCPALISFQCDLLFGATLVVTA